VCAGILSFSLPLSERRLFLFLSFHPPLHPATPLALKLRCKSRNKITHGYRFVVLFFLFVVFLVAAAAVFLSLLRYSISFSNPCTLLAYRVKNPPPNNTPTATKGARMLTTAMITCGSTIRSAKSFFSRLDLKYSSGSFSRVGREGGPSNNLLLLLLLWLEEKEEEENPRATVTGRAVLVLMAGRKPPGLKAATRPQRQARARAQRKATRDMVVLELGVERTKAVLVCTCVRRKERVSKCRGCACAGVVGNAYSGQEIAPDDAVDDLYVSCS